MKMPEPLQKNYDELLPDQKQAVDIRDKNVLISASAGTGKSHVLINRLVKKIIDRELEVDEVIVMTFTDAAASELKAKLMAALIANRDACADQEMKDYLNAQLAKIPNAIISTIHSFSLDIIKKHGYAIMLDPASIGNVMEDADEMLFERVALNKTLSDPDEYADLLLQTSNTPIDMSKLEDAIKLLADRKNNFVDYEDWKEKVLEDYRLFEEGKLPPRLEKQLKSLYKEYIREAQGAIEPLRKYGAQWYIPPKNKPKQTVEEYADEMERYFQELLGKIDGMSMQEIMDENYKPFGNAPSMKNNDMAPKEPYEAIKTQIYGLKKNIKGINIEELINTSRLTAPYIRKLLELTDRYCACYEELKAQRDLISFDDMSRLAIRILEANGSKIANEEYRARYKEVMVDEYQDSSYEQEELIRLVSRDNNIFRVGDIKQSIYSFRNAKPQLMQHLIDNVSDKDELVHLSTNFRSGKGILDFSNYLFQYLFNIRRDDTYVHEEDLLPAKKNRDKAGVVNLVSVPTDEEATLDDMRKELYDWVVADIQKRVEEGAEYGDFMILVRKNKYKERFMDLLTRYNIPAYAAFDTGFFNDAAVTTVISLLKLITDPFDRPSIIDVLRGPIYERSDDDIANWFIAEDEGVVEDLREFVKRLQDCTGIDDIFLTIYKEKDWYLNNISIKQRDNLDSLFQLVVNFQKNQTGLANLVEYLEKQKEVDRSEATSTSTQDDVVQVMSIHQSKGLSGKIVYLMDFADGQNSNTDYIMVDEELGVGANYIYDKYRMRRKNPYRDLIKNKQALDEFDEEMRLLYVAMTRAEEELNIVGFVCEPKEVIALSTEKIRMINSSPKEIIETIMTVYPDKYIDSLVNKNIVVSRKLPPVNRKTDKDKKITKYPLKQENKAGEKKNKAFIYPLNYDGDIASERGTIMHRAIELLKITEVTEKDLDDLGLPFSAEDKEKILKFYADPFTKELINNDNQHEYPYIGYSDGYATNNVIDLLSVGDDEVYIIDFKSDRNTSERKLIDRHQAQLNRYYNAVISRDEYKKKTVRMLIYSFDLGCYVDIPVIA